MPKRGKRYLEAQKKIDSSLRHALPDAIDKVKAAAGSKFDESVDLAVRLGVNPRHADQMVRGACSLPFGTGKEVRVLVFAQGEAAKAAEEAGADFVGSDDLVNKILNEGWTDFDKAVATRDMMGKVGRLGRVLGPRSLMPNPKVGTVVGPEEVAATVAELKRGKIDFRVEKAGIIHVSIGKVSMDTEKIVANIGMLIGTLVRMKPTTAKGTYIRSVSVSSTMGPGVRVDTLDAQRHSDDQ